jgi:hypothetical protein
MKERQIQLSDQSSARLSIAQEQRGNLFMNNHKKKTFLLFKWDIIRDREAEKLKDQAIKLKRKKFVVSWLKLVTLTQANRILFTVFDAKKKIKKKQELEYSCLCKIFRNYKKSINRFGKKVENRNNRQYTM